MRTIRQEGALALYRGMALPLAATIVETATLFLANGALKRALHDRGHIAPGEELPLPMVLMAGGGTGLIVSFVLTPIELVKCRMQVSMSPAAAAAAVAAASAGTGAVAPSPAALRVYRGPLDCLMQSVRREGLAVVYRGHMATMLREIPGTAGWFGAYECFARAMTPPGAAREDLPASTIIAAGALGGMSYWSIMYPCDTVKSAMQIAEGPLTLPPATAATAAASQQPASTASGASAASSTAHGAAGRGASDAIRSAVGMGGGGASTMRLVATPVAAAAAAVAQSASASAAAAARVVAPTFLNTLRYIYRTGGIRGLYAGFIPTLLRAAPSNAAIFVGYEWAAAQLKPLI